MTAFDLDCGAYRHNGDHELMTSLGLRTWSFHQEFTDLGTVIINEVHEESSAATIKVEVSALPAQFWRFTVTQEEGVTVLTTGSGGFSDYWPIAKLVADNMLIITKETK